MEFVFRPIESWPLKKTRNKRSKWTFKAKWSDTLDKLETELAHLKARSLVLQVDVSAKDLRVDGMLRANAKVNYPGVILSFDSKVGPLQFPCDSCEYWQHNVRSIALGLESLRAVDRYGITRQAEQYKGWDKLPDPTTAGVRIPESLADARTLLANVTELDAGNPDLLNSAFVELQRAHPDRGGDGKLFRAINAAIQMLKEQRP